MASTASSASAAPRSTTSASQERQRSCAICARRKVSCDKHFPCGRCQRAGIRCVLPALDRRPGWARRMMNSSLAQDGDSGSRQSPSAGPVAANLLDKVRMLESLVRDLRGELEQTRSASSVRPLQDASQPQTAAPAVGDPGASGGSRDATYRRDLNGAFWSQMNTELQGFRGDGPGNQVEAFPERDDQPVPLDQPSGSGPHQSRSAFVFKSTADTGTEDAAALFPMTSQIPFLLEVYTERVHSVTCVPHMPSLKALLRRRHGKGLERFSSEDQALMFSVFYTAICSLDDDVVNASFNVSRSRLAHDYRKGLGLALTRADFLNNPSDTLVQALLIFLTLARLEESPKYLWMMTGLVIRMARFLRFNEDGSTARNMKPFQAEMQRRVWWNLCALDLRATEDQGTELAIPRGSFSTCLPTNVGDEDLWPDMEHPPSPGAGLTNASLLRLCSKVGRGTQKMISVSRTATMEDHIRLLDQMGQELDHDYFSVTDQSRHQAYLAAAGTMRVFLARLTLLAFLPTLCSSPNAEPSTELRNKLLIAGIEIAELNHALNTHPDCHLWRWVYQTQQHWHAVVFLLLEICRRSWSPTVERAWVALQSPWLLPARADWYKNPSVWVPLRKLMSRAKMHRENDLQRLKSNAHVASELESEERNYMPIPSSSTTFPMYYNEEMFYTRWWASIKESNPEEVRPPTGVDQHQAQQQPSSMHNWVGPGARTSSHTVSPSVKAPLPSMQGATAQAASLSGPVDLTEFDSLDSFLGNDTELELFDTMDDSNFVNFDWNSWFASANGTL